MKTTVHFLIWCGMSSVAWANEPLPFPDQLSEFQHSEFVDFEKDSPGLGYANGYYGTNANATVYLYTRSEIVPDALDNSFFQRELSIARSEFEALAVRDEDEQVQIARYGEVANVGDYPCLSMLASFVSASGPRITMTCVMPFNQQILKVRYTFLPVSGSDQGPRLARFLGALAEFLHQYDSTEPVR